MPYIIYKSRDLTFVQSGHLQHHITEMIFFAIFALALAALKVGATLSEGVLTNKTYLFNATDDNKIEIATVPTGSVYVMWYVS